MDKISVIEKNVKEKQSQYYEGYKDIIDYMSGFNDDELDYIEATEKAGISAFNATLSGYKGFFPIVVSLFALMISCIPDKVKENIEFLDAAEGEMLFFSIIVLLSYYVVNLISSKQVAIKTYVLEIIAKVRKDRM